ncbi:DUF952 domain-containing protein [Aestuariivirga sp.]|uniref:DUF952 domain-containing protein n=1 Tax=Aestuariivirga sp. TaxID=2650926 RepID=UPI0035941ECE
MRILFKILDAGEWSEAVACGQFDGSAVDLKDGFIHLSAAHQVRETAARHFAGRDGLVLVAFAEHDLAGLTWEASRGGDLFPHVYGAIPTRAAMWVKPLPLENGVHRFPGEAGA